MTDYFKVNEPSVIHEVIDGEAVLVNLETGSYYSIDNVGAVIWNHIENGLSIGQIIEAVAHQYVGNHGTIENGVKRLVTQLQEESLIVPNETSRSNGNDKVNVAIANSDIDKPRFEMPVLQKYTDMEDLLLLDPIHDVDEMGWPHLPEDA